MLSFGYSSDNQHDKGGNYVEQNLFRAGHRRRHYEVGAFLARCRRYDLRGGFRVQAVFHCDQSGFLTGFLIALSGIWIMISAFTREEKRTAWFFYGFLLTVAGALLLYNPVAEIIFLAWCLATFFLSSGVIGISISSSISTDSVNKTFNIISCLLSILVGLFLLFAPVFAFAQLVLVTGIVLLAEGLLFVIFSFFMPKEIQQ